jgi:ABC-2 type transport system permease protein
MGGPGAPPLLVVSDPVRGVAVAMLSGRVERAFFEVLPEVSLGGVVDLLDLEYLDLTPEQRASARAGLERRAEAARRLLDRGEEPGRMLPALIEREDVVGRSGARNHVAYYAGGVAFLFLLFSAMQGAVTLLEERESGILDRLLAGPGGAGVLVDGKFLYLVGQGFVQIAVIFVVAWLGYGVELPRNVGPWAVTTLAASLAASGFGLLVATSFRTRRQAQTFANVAILVMSALGGSMVPRFFMPPLLQSLGWLTPNTWALEAYAGIFWRDDPVVRLLLPWAALSATGVLGYLVARRRARALEAI